MLVAFQFSAGHGLLVRALRCLSQGQRLLESSTMAQKWKIGDVVQLKSGGPPMTVRGYEKGTDVICQWIDGKKPYTERYHEDQLQTYDDNITTGPTMA